MRILRTTGFVHKIGLPLFDVSYILITALLKSRWHNNHILHNRSPDSGLLQSGLPLTQMMFILRPCNHSSVVFLEGHISKNLSFTIFLYHLPLPFPFTIPHFRLLFTFTAYLKLPFTFTAYLYHSPLLLTFAIHHLSVPLTLTNYHYNLPLLLTFTANLYLYHLRLPLIFTTYFYYLPLPFKFPAHCCHLPKPFTFTAYHLPLPCH